MNYGYNEYEYNIDVDIAQLNMSIFEVYRKIERGDIDLDNNFIRKNLWSKQQKSKLIESIILNIPIPSIYLSEEDYNKIQIIDGYQRLITIYEYITNKFKLVDCKYFRNDVCFNDLPIRIQRKIQDYNISVFLIRKNNDLNFVYEIFERLNTNGYKLNYQEIRNFIYREKGIPFINELADNEIFKKLLKNKKVSFKHKQDEELVLRFMTYYYQGYESYNGNMKIFLNNTLDRYDKYIYKENHFKQVFIDTIELIDLIFSEEAFTIKNRNNFNTGLYEILTYTFSKYSKCKIQKKANEIKYKLKWLIDNDKEFYNSLKLSAYSKKNTNIRFEKWEKCLIQILEGNNDK